MKIVQILSLAAACGVAIVGCKTTEPVSINTQEKANPQILIVYYEQGEKETALKVAEELGAKVVAEYNTLNGIAVHTKHPTTAIEKFKNTKGILSAEVSQIYELH